MNPTSEGELLDLDERKATEQRLKEQESELRQILDITPELIVVFGPAFERLYANRAALDYAGVALEEWRHDDGEVVHPDDRPAPGTAPGGDFTHSFELR